MKREAERKISGKEKKKHVWMKSHDVSMKKKILSISLYTHTYIYVCMYNYYLVWRYLTKQIKMYKNRNRVVEICHGYF